MQGQTKRGNQAGKRKITEYNETSNNEGYVLSMHDTSDRDSEESTKCLFCGCLYSEDKHGEHQYRVNSNEIKAKASMQKVASGGLTRIVGADNLFVCL